MKEYTIADIQKECTDWEKSEEAKKIADKAQYFIVKKIIQLTNRVQELENGNANR
jgi:hypothetical protein